MPSTSSAAATALSTEELFARVRQLTPRLAVFDCDGTLWSPDAGSGFMRWTMEDGLLSREATKRLNARYDLYNRGEVSETAICGEMVQIYSGLSADAIRRSAAEFFRTQIKPHIFPEMAALVAELDRSGCALWAVSSTCDWVIEEGLRYFNIPAERILAACVECVDGFATDRLRDVPSGEAKATALARAGITKPDAVFGNSVHDAAMLAIARAPFAINPSPELARLSTERGWSIYFPTTVRS